MDPGPRQSGFHRLSPRYDAEQPTSDLPGKSNSPLLPFFSPYVSLSALHSEKKADRGPKSCDCKHSWVSVGAVSGRAYDESGVGGQGEALSAILRHLQPTLAFPEGVESLTGFGHYASVLKIAPELALAITTDGVGSKTLIASAMGRYDTIGFDCIAMNVNDIICIGARPIAMVDYLGVNTLDRSITEEILRGLAAAAKEAGIAIPGGELAQLPEVIGGTSSITNLNVVQPDRNAFDLVGACVGLMHPNDLLLGDRVRPGDVAIGFAASGIHSNGLTLARRVLLHDAGYSLDDEIPNLNGTLGEELLRPTEIYVNAVTALRAAGVDIHGLVHIT
ncbi:MAG: phosphoribosylformylglycinamidine cyclo-ligase, partial [Actinomycetota bacterium]|nr:phosphoribosylformylglycinamidine cyclo-ligase [Actinomycetota bacterium]